MTILHIVLPFSVLLLLGVALKNLLRTAEFSISKQKLLQKPLLRKDEFRKLVEKYGTNSNSFLTLYSGFQYFTSEDSSKEGAIAFIDTNRYWVGASEPLGPDPLGLLAEFRKTAAKIGKGVVLLPIGPDLAEKSQAIGYGTLMAGAEPTFIFDHYPPRSDWYGVVSTAKQMLAKGAVVKEFSYQSLTIEQKAGRTHLNALS